VNLQAGWLSREAAGLGDFLEGTRLKASAGISGCRNQLFRKKNGEINFHRLDAGIRGGQTRVAGFAL